MYAALPGGGLPPDESTGLAKEVAEELQRAHPAEVTATMTKARRAGKVFLDWSQNAGSKTTISPYSLRGREQPWVAAPLSWAEVQEGAEDPFGLDCNDLPTGTIARTIGSDVAELLRVSAGQEEPVAAEYSKVS